MPRGGTFIHGVLSYAQSLQGGNRRNAFLYILLLLWPCTNSRPENTFWLQPGPFSDQTDKEFAASNMGAGYFTGRRPSPSAAGRKLLDVQLLLPTSPSPSPGSPPSGVSLLGSSPLPGKCFGFWRYVFARKTQIFWVNSGGLRLDTTIHLPLALAIPVHPACRSW